MLVAPHEWARQPVGCPLFGVHTLTPAFSRRRKQAEVQRLEERASRRKPHTILRVSGLVIHELRWLSALDSPGGLPAPSKPIWPDPQPPSLLGPPA
jgi:hypothetical protein